MGTHPPGDGVRGLTDRLWAERHLLELLELRFLAAHLILATDRRRFTAIAFDEIEQVVERIRSADAARALAVDRLAAAWGLPPKDLALRDLADRAGEPGASILGEHREALLALIGEIRWLSAETRRMAEAALDRALRGDRRSLPRRGGSLVGASGAARPTLTVVAEQVEADALDVEMELLLEEIALDAALAPSAHELPPSLTAFLQ